MNNRRTDSFFRHKLLATLVGLCMLMSSVAAFAASGAATEIKTATEHAGYAAKSSKVKMVHTHLHHVLNCLVGEHGQAFYAAAGNPCKGQGNGALNDLNDNQGAKTALEQAKSLAEIGIKVDNLKAAQYTAQAVHALLESAATKM